MSNESDEARKCFADFKKTSDEAAYLDRMKELQIYSFNKIIDKIKSCESSKRFNEITFSCASTPFVETIKQKPDNIFILENCVIWPQKLLLEFFKKLLLDGVVVSSILKELDYYLSLLGNEFECEEILKMFKPLSH